MAKRHKCVHGNPSVRFDGCFHCVQRIFGMDARMFQLCIDEQILMEILWAQFPDQESWEKAVKAAKEKVALAKAHQEQLDAAALQQNSSGTAMEIEQLNAASTQRLEAMKARMKQ